MRKLLSKPTTNPPSPHDAPGGLGLAKGRPAERTSPFHLRAPAQDTSYEAGVPIAALDKSPDGQMAVLGSWHVLKTVRLEGQDVHEGVDLRTLISLQATSGSSLGEQLAVQDVKWARGSTNDACIFTACVAGKIFRYDLASIGRVGRVGPGAVDVVQAAQEDARHINTLDVNPHRGSYLLAGGQDGVVRCLDIRAAVPSRTGPTFRAMQAFRNHSDSVRHVQWSPRDGFYFACGTENGTVLKWDIRKTAAPILRIMNAHESACTAVAWHPDGVHLLSAGSDAACHVWDVSPSASRHQRPLHSLAAPAPVAAAAWRPGQWSASANGLRAAQVAVSYGSDLGGAGASKQRSGGIEAVHVWDFARPTLPYRVVERGFSHSPSALLWKNSSLLWTVGADGIFAQNDVNFAPRVLDRTAVSTLAFSSRGDVLAFVDERPRLSSRGGRRHMADTEDAHSTAATAAATATTSTSTPPPPPPPLPAASASTASGTSKTTASASLSLSGSEDESIRSFLAPRRRRKRRDLASAQPLLSTTPPSSSTSSHAPYPNQHSLAPATANVPSLLSLEQALQASGTYRPQQIMALGHVPSAARQDVYGYLATCYLTAFDNGLLGSRTEEEAAAKTGSGLLPARLAAILDGYACAAEKVCQFRLAQVWRILAFAMDLLLRRRANYHRDRRRRHRRHERHQERRQEHQHQHQNQKHQHQTSWKSPSAASTVTAQEDSHRPLRSLLTEEIESSSNMPTPLVRPQQPPLRPLQPSDVHSQGTAVSSFHTDTLLSNSSGSHGSHGSFSLLAGDSHGGSWQSSHRNSHSNSHLQSRSHSQSHSHPHTPTPPILEGYDFYDAEAIARAVDVPHSKKGAEGAEGAASVENAQGTRGVAGSSAATEASSLELHSPFRRKDSEQIFELSQDDSKPGASQSSSTPASAEPARPDNTPIVQMKRRESLRPARLVHLNKALLALEWTGSDVAADDHTYLSQDTITSATTTTAYPSQTVPGWTDKNTGQRQVSSLAASRPISISKSASTATATATASPPSAPTAWRNDYLPWPNDPPFPFALEPASAESEEEEEEEDHSEDGDALDDSLLFTSSQALNPYVIVRRALDFETRTSPLHAAAIILLLMPLMPASIIDPLQARAILRQHHARLMGMKLFLQAALLRKLLGRGDDEDEGAQLGGVSASVDDTPSLSSMSIVSIPSNVVTGYLCPQCRKPRDLTGGDSASIPASTSSSFGAGLSSLPSVGPSAASSFTAGASPSSTSKVSLWKCERCSAVMAPCAVCGHRDSAQDVAGESLSNRQQPQNPQHPDQHILSTWWYCAGCGHGGHSNCLYAWHGLSDKGEGRTRGKQDKKERELDDLSGGCCPLDGCGHDCLPGRWRAESALARSEDLTNALRAALPMPLDHRDHRESDFNHNQLFYADGREATQSRAVDLVRDSLGSGNVATIGTSPGRQSGFGAWEPRERERRKSVKFASDEGK